MSTSFNKLDLNLLRVFDAVMDERSVLRASQRICLSQSAVSHALARLRDSLDDELFIRTTTGMQPTARALTMAPLIREAWTSLEAAIGRPKFDPASSTKRFTIAVSDFVATVMVPGLLQLLKQEAPSVNLVIRPDSQIDLVEQIDLGQVDAAIGTFSHAPSRFRSSPLFAYDDVLISKSSRRLSKVSLEQLSALTVATVSLYGEDEELIGGFLSQGGLCRRSEMYDRSGLEQAFAGSIQRPPIAVSLPHFLALPTLLEQSGLSAIVPRPLAKLLSGMHQLASHELPYNSLAVDVSALWHERTTKDAAQQWLREMLRRATAPLRSRSAEPEFISRRAGAPESSPRSANFATTPAADSAIR
jgi:DNA-binding transcriptional LysR family regulator